ncbi:membrane-associating domain-containing protein [Pyronema omphalodes]|nr:membrane-associating domain-containing protein [Pyronema omphalodes]
MGFNFILPLRVVQGVLALAVLISASVFVSADKNGSGEGSFMIFNPIFTFLALGYLVAAPLWVQSIHNEWAVLVVEAVTWVLWLAGFAALAAAIPGMYCVNTGDQLCAALSAGKAATALGAFEWLAFSGSLGLTIHAIIQSRRGGAEEGDMEGQNMEEQQYPQVVPMQEQVPRQQMGPQQVYQQ